MGKQLDLVTRLCLNNQQQIRLLRSVVIETILIKVDTPSAKAMFAATKSFSEQMSDMDKEIKETLPIGLGHHHRYNALLGIVKEAISKTASASNSNADKDIKEFCTSMVAAGPAKFENLQKEIKAFNLTKAFDKATKKLEVAVVQGSKAAHIWESYLRPFIVQHEKAKVKVGQAPQGDLERRLQDILDAQEAMQPGGGSSSQR